MRSTLNQMSRVALGAGALLLMLAHATAAPTPPASFKEIAADRAARKQAAAQGKLPLPGTPDLSKLDERLTAQSVPEDASLLIRIFKAESEMEIWTSRGDGSGY